MKKVASLIQQEGILAVKVSERSMPVLKIAGTQLAGASLIRNFVVERMQYVCVVVSPAEPLGSNSNKNGVRGLIYKG